MTSQRDAELLAWLGDVLRIEGAARAIRDRSGLSATTVGQVVGATPQAVGRWERGERVPRTGRAVAYARLLHRLSERQGVTS